MKVIRGVAAGFSVVAAALAFQLPALAKCAVTEGTTVIVRVPVGNLQVDTSARDSVNMSVNSSDFAFRELWARNVL